MLKRRNRPNHFNYSKFPLFSLALVSLVYLINPFRILRQFVSSFSPSFFFYIQSVAMAATDAERVKPTKPDEAAYKTSLAEAEKEHTAAQEKLVWMHLFGTVT